MAATPRPAAFSTLVLTDVSADALHVGSAVGAPACTGGIKAGAGTFMSLRTTTPDAIELNPGVPAVVTQKLYNNSGNLYWNGAPLAAGSSVSGTPNAIAKFTGAATVGNSRISDDGSLIVMSGHTSVLGNLVTTGGAQFPGGVNAGPGANNIIGADGRIPALTATYIANLSGAALTGVTAGTLAAGTHAGSYTFSNPANNYYGNGSGITGLNASELIWGTVPGGRLSGTYMNVVTFNNIGNNFVGTFQGSYWGNATNLTGLQASNLNGTVPAACLPSTTYYSLGIGENAQFGSVDMNGGGPALTMASNVMTGMVGPQSGWIKVKDSLGRKLNIPFWFSP